MSKCKFVAIISLWKNKKNEQYKVFIHNMIQIKHFWFTIHKYLFFYGNTCSLPFCLFLAYQGKA